MKQIKIHETNDLNRQIRIETDPDCAEKYHVFVKNTGEWRKLTTLQYHKGESHSGVNGLTNEVLIAVMLDRLEGYQTSEFKCRENALAITKLEEALHWLKHRTDQRLVRGVEGTHQP